MRTVLHKQRILILFFILLTLAVGTAGAADQLPIVFVPFHY